MGLPDNGTKFKQSDRFRVLCALIFHSNRTDKCGQDTEQAGWNLQCYQLILKYIGMNYLQRSPMLAKVDVSVYSFIHIALRRGFMY